MSELGMTSMDFAGFIKSPVETGGYVYGLRYEEFIAPLIAAAQAQHRRALAAEARISMLEGQIVALMARVSQ